MKPDKNNYFRSAKTTLKFTNKDKRMQLHSFINGYRLLTTKFIDLIWETEKLPALLPKEITEKVQSKYSARVVQCAAKQASGIVRGTRQKQSERLWRIRELEKKGKQKQANKLLKVYNSAKVTKPVASGIQPELDSRFIKFDLDNETCFDGWITLSSLLSPVEGKRQDLSIVFPFKRTKTFNKWLKHGALTGGIRLSKKYIMLNFKIKKQTEQNSSQTERLGIDIGVSTAVTCSNGVTSSCDSDGIDLLSILKKLSRKKKGSKRFARAQTQRKQFINWAINQLDLSSTKEVCIENIKYLRYKKRTNRLLGHWTYTEFIDKILRYCEERNVFVHMVNPAFTSQCCPECDWVQKTNRKAKQFKCKQCGFAADADWVGAFNIRRVPDLKDLEFKRMDNVNGFHWPMRTGAYSPC